MKSVVTENLEKNTNELQKVIKDEELNLEKLAVAISLGREKKTHLVSQSRKKIATLKTLLAQKKFMEEVS